MPSDQNTPHKASSPQTPTDNDPLSSSIYHEYILTLNTLKSHLQRIDALTRLNLRLDHDHAVNIKNIVETLNDMIERSPSLRSIPKIDYQYSDHLLGEVEQNMLHHSSIEHLSAAMHPQESESKSSAELSGSADKHKTSLESKILSLSDQPKALAQFLDEMVKDANREDNHPLKKRLVQQLDVFSVGKEGFRLLITHLLDKVLIRPEKFIQGLHLLIILHSNGMTPLFKGVSQSQREHLIDLVCNQQSWIEECFDDDNLMILKNQYDYLKQIDGE